MFRWSANSCSKRRRNHQAEMALYTDKTTPDVSGWVAEKADESLKATCDLVDWFKQKAPQLSEQDIEEVREFLFYFLHDLSKLSDFGHGERHVWSR